MAVIHSDIKLLEIILRELKEAVVVSDLNARILLYNEEAKRLFRSYPAMGLGRSLYGVCAREPVEHALRMLKHRSTEENGAGPAAADDRFVCATVDGAMLLHCHINKIDEDSGRAGIFIFTFEDITGQIAETAGREHLLDRMINSLRAPLSNLNAAAATLQGYPEMPPDIRAEFEDVIIRESGELTRRFESVVRESKKTSHMQWPLFDVNSADLIGCLVRRMQREDGFTVTMTGVPLWLQADSYSLMLALDNLVRFVHKFCDAAEIDIEVLLGDRRVYIDIVWQGKPIPQAAIDPVLAVPLFDPAAGMTVADVLKNHDSEIWSQEHRREGYSVLRIPVPDSPKQWEAAADPLPQRPEFYDFSLAGREELEESGDRPLSSLNYVIFDMETNGFHPDEGDEILSIAAVRIVNGRILSGERFASLIKPKRPISAGSIYFLGITEDLVREEPSIEEVLPQFRSFVNDAVLVAHNAAFDMNFFRMAEEQTGVRFDNPVLDTLLLSLILDKDRTDYTLENIGRRLEIEVMGNHTTMDDCLLTAQIFLRLLDLLEAKGITTLADIISASVRVVEKKRRQIG